MEPAGISIQITLPVNKYIEEYEAIEVSNARYTLPFALWGDKTMDKEVIKGRIKIYKQGLDYTWTKILNPIGNWAISFHPSV